MKDDKDKLIDILTHIIFDQIHQINELHEKLGEDHYKRNTVTERRFKDVIRHTDWDKLDPNGEWA